MLLFHTSFDLLYESVLEVNEFFSIFFYAGSSYDSTNSVEYTETQYH
jgi:hypothetical protein